MKSSLYRGILRLFGWKVVVTLPDYSKCVICVAPHTSNWDFILGKLAYGSIGRKAGFLMKKEWFFFPLGYLFRAMGGIPVDRKSSSSLTDQLADRFEKNDRLAIAITPEATRKPNPDWKLGFYYTALKAQVPIVLAYIDYKDKQIGLTQSIIPSGNVEKEMTEIKNFYRNRQGKNTRRILPYRYEHFNFIPFLFHVPK